MSDELPKGWATVSFMEVFDIQGGTQPPKKLFKYTPANGYIRLLQIRDFGEKPVPTYIPLKSNLKTCGKDDILIGRYGASVGRICTDMEGAYNVALTKVIISKPIKRRYVFHLLQAPCFQMPILDIERSAQDGFNKEDLAEIQVPIAPLTEQRHIVAKLDRLLPKVQTSQKRLERISRILKRFRQSVIAAACSGDFDLIPLSNLGTVSGGLTKNSKRDSLTIQMPYLRVANVYANELRLEEIKFIGVAKSEIQRTLLHLNDLLIVEGNGSLDQIGRVAIWDGSIPDCLHQNHLIKFRSSNKVLSQFILLWMMSPQGRGKIQEVASSTTGLHTLSISKIENLQIPLPSLSQQQEIVRRVESLFKLADQIEARYQKAKASVDKLTQSILAKAFRGELVPQDPNDKPASVLLEKIKIEREKQRPSEKTKRPPIKKKKEVANG